MFTVTASGLRLNYTWMQNGSALPSDGRFVSADETLTIQNVSVSDVGNYSCLVSNAAGSDTSDPARLTLSELCKQFQVHYSAMCFDHVVAFKALQCRTSVKGRAHTHTVDSWTPDKSMQWI